MNKQAMAALATFALAGCAASVTSSGPRTVMVNAGLADGSGAMKTATAECAKHGRHARLAAKPTDDTPRQWTFDCVN